MQSFFHRAPGALAAPLGAFMQSHLLRRARACALALVALALSAARLCAQHPPPPPPVSNTTVMLNIGLGLGGPVTGTISIGRQDQARAMVRPAGTREPADATAVRP
jgi:hypothetical protein